MRLNKFVIIILLFVFNPVQAQDEEKILFSIDGEDVYNAEFVRVYEKNKDIVVEDEQKEFEDYFNLFVDFKLKLKQARELSLDTISAYIDELAKYREQLIQPYLQNPEATESLVKEAYERTLQEVNASHILVRVEPDAIPADTLKAYLKIDEARGKIIKGASFDSIARMYSEDPSVKTNNGNLGYFSAFSMVYSFENAAYETEKGAISKPFRTRFGYHILKINDKRESPGEVQVAHIMIKKDSTVLKDTKDQIDQIYLKLQQGGDFAAIAKEQSDDYGSAQKGGLLPKFGTGRMIKSFEDVAFSLNEEGDFSEPFETQYGWHILKLLKKYPIPEYEELYPKLESKVKNGSRSSYVERSLADRIVRDYKYVTYKNKLQKYPSIKGFEQSDDTLLRIEEKVYVGRDFYLYAKDLNQKTLEEMYSDFCNKMVIGYYKENLDKTNKEFALTYQEYKDGLLLFELLQREVWQKSETDSIGLQTFFESNRTKYTWKKRGSLVMASCTRLEKAELVRNLLSQGESTASIKDKVNEGATIHVLFSKGKLEEGSSKLPKGYTLEEGVSKIYEENEDDFTIIRVDHLFGPQWKTLNETRGEVMNDYQKYLEDQWVKNLHKKYQVKINHKNYKELKKRFSGI
ncbi:peptidylprolyl isomerase [Lutimonas zeaxanthinifaciens]|uniref:peptidylprolyl isomerase n=1 Tax=Lutimonas zeaxanthinifaciens TaxID=3060215 RepID=UPI00265D5AE7|nr:peptidylprolyl isomerase [Lutimonas sp. YSD2104]WKK67457.1 peptidylprolyl isomerase [Lutimonas sp. YSD2104]